MKEIKIITAVGAAVLLITPLSVALRALSGWLVTLWFPITAAKVAAKVAASTGYQIGAVLGSVSSFLRPVS